MDRCVVLLKRIKPEANMDQKTKANRNAEKLRAVQLRYEQSFSCIICLSPHLEMVTGLCQHRFCCGCLYDEDGVLREQFQKCALCQEHSFPYTKPEIPDDNKEMMQCLGVRKCPNAWCKSEMWDWELEEHQKFCKELPKTTQQTNADCSMDQASGKENSKSTRPCGSRRPCTRSSSSRNSHLYLSL